MKKSCAANKKSSNGKFRINFNQDYTYVDEQLI